jgi:hypothetical protein
MPVEEPSTASEAGVANHDSDVRLRVTMIAEGAGSGEGGLDHWLYGIGFSGLVADDGTIF